MLLGIFSEGDFQLQIHSLHKLPRRPPRFTGGFQHGYLFPQYQTASEVDGHEGRVGQMTGDPGGVQCGASGTPNP